MRHLYLIRHGQASFGSHDYDRLSEKGADQSRLLGAWFKRCGINVHHAVAGGSKRHVQTAESFFEAYGGRPEQLARLHRDTNFNEIDSVDIISPTRTRKPADAAPKDGTTSMTFDEYKKILKPAYLRWTSGLYDHKYADPFPAYSARCEEGIVRAINLTGPEENVAVFTSGGTIAMICRLVMPLGDEATSTLMWLVWNTSVSRLAWDGNKFALTLFNSTAHLDHTGDATLITIS